MASVQLLLLACVVGCVFGTPAPRIYRGKYVPDDVKDCYSNTGFEVDKFQTDFACFKPFQGEANDPEGPTETCVCKPDELCIYSKLGKEPEIQESATTVAPVESGDTIGGADLELDTSNVAGGEASGQEEGDGGSGSGATEHANESLDKVERYQYKCLNKDDSEVMENSHNPAQQEVVSYE